MRVVGQVIEAGCREGRPQDLGAKFAVDLVDVGLMACDLGLTSTEGAIAVETEVFVRGERYGADAGDTERAILAARSAQALIFGAGLVSS